MYLIGQISYIHICHSVAFQFNAVNDPIVWH